MRGRLAAMIAMAVMPLHAAMPEVQFAAAPGPDGNIHPNLIIGLALGTPAAAAAHRDSIYNRSAEYIGYFNPRKCYRYVRNEPSEGYFEVMKDADALHECDGNAFSGNFMNWAAMSMLDILRYAMTGGQRIVDTTQLTILQRAWLPDHFQANEDWFPRRMLTAGEQSGSPRRVTPFSAPTIYMVSCRDRILFSERNSSGNGCNASAASRRHSRPDDRTLGEYAIRVKACDLKEAAGRTDLCRRYGSHYKPVGALQRHAASLRFAFVMQDTKGDSENPLLELAPRYIGAEKFVAPGFAAAPNGLAEWDATSGVNKPGMGQRRDGGILAHLDSVGYQGRYNAVTDPGLLHHAAFRLLQGDTSSAAESGQNDTSPADCRRSMIVLIADGSATAGGRSSRRQERGLPGDHISWTRKLSEIEADKRGIFRNPAPRPTLAQQLAGRNQAVVLDNYAVSGLAYKANIQGVGNDHRASGQTFVIELNPGGEVRDTPLYLAAKYGGFTDRNRDGNPFITAATDNGMVVSDDEWSDHGTAAGYFAVQDPGQLVQAVQRLFARLAALRAPYGGPTISAAGSATDGRAIYQPIYDALKWGGSLRKLIPPEKKEGDIGTAPRVAWDAAKILSGSHERLPEPQQRRIYTLDADGRTIPFEWMELAVNQRALLDVSPTEHRTDGLGPQRLAWLRGAREMENGLPRGILRARSVVLGDILDSQPLYVENQKAKMVYVGANDGMLHAFNAENGRELFAYVPDALLSYLPELAAPAYRHRPYINGQLTASTLLLNGRHTTVLAGGMGGGAQGVFALDVGNPADFGNGSGALWEFTDKDDPDIGNVMGRPVIARLRAGINAYRYFLVVSGGLNNYRDDGIGRTSRSGRSALFLLALDKPRGQAWREGINYFKFSVPLLDTRLPNGLSAPALATGSDGTARFVYAGDLQGNLWRFDFSNPEHWRKANSAHRTPSLLFTARDEGGRRQPITMQPQAAFAEGSGFVVLFGTGKFIEDADAAPGHFSTQSFYGIHDRLQPGYRVGGREELSQRKLEPVVTQGRHALGIAADGPDAIGSKGWYFDFLISDKTGERSISTAQLAYGMVYFHTLIPGRGHCVPPRSRFYVINVLQGVPQGGRHTGLLFEEQLPGTPLLTDKLQHTGPASAQGRRVMARKILPLDPATGEPLPAAPPAFGSDIIVLPAGRLSWREIPNWQELHDEAGKK